MAGGKTQELRSENNADPATNDNPRYPEQRTRDIQAKSLNRVGDSQVIHVVKCDLAGKDLASEGRYSSNYRGVGGSRGIVCSKKQLEGIAIMNRRRFLFKSLQTAAVAAVLRSARELFAAQAWPVANSSFGLPASPKEAPLCWRTRADSFDSYVMNPANKVLRVRPDGTTYFASALEGTGDGGLTTFAPIALGKILRGDPVEQLLPSMSAYFNDQAGIYLDGTHADLCEYWYLMNVNALAFGITRARFLHDSLWTGRLRKSADRLIELAHQISYNFNDQGYRFNTKSPFTNKDIYRQPDTIGGYAYLMLFAHEIFGDAKYLEESRHALNLYQSFASNPWYEIPSAALATLAAARLSTQHPDINFKRVLGFALSTGGRPMQTGVWGGSEVNGLMAGFSTEPEGEAYSMESLMPLTYLLPALRYRPEYATEVARYLLNTAANMRLFYSDCVPRENQSRPDLTSAVPYERLTKTVDGHSPFASGDYDSDRSIYGGAYALTWGELVKPTEDKFILQMSLSRTDFLSAKTYPTWLYYNPYEETKQAALKLDEGAHDLYELKQRAFIQKRCSGSVSLSIPPKDSVVVVAIPAGAKGKMEKGVLLCDGVPVDYGRL